MKRTLLAAALAALPAAPALPADAAPPQLSLEQKTLLRCSAAFAIIAYDQKRGDKDALAWPPLQEKGQEYFVRAGAQLMEQLNLTEEQVDALYRAEVKRLQDESATSPDPKAFVASVMEPCLLSLEVSGV